MVVLSKTSQYQLIKFIINSPNDSWGKTRIVHSTLPSAMLAVALVRPLHNRMALHRVHATCFSSTFCEGSQALDQFFLPERFFNTWRWQVHEHQAQNQRSVRWTLCLTISQEIRVGRGWLQHACCCFSRCIAMEKMCVYVTICVSWTRICDVLELLYACE